VIVISHRCDREQSHREERDDVNVTAQFRCKLTA
jgi:hypothetical protein